MAVIEVEHLRKRYGATVAVEDVSFAVEPGEIFGIVGPNGAGKTTTVECVEGLRVPDGGRIRVLGLDPQADRPELRQRLGVQLQTSELPERIGVREALRLYATFYRDPVDADELLERLGLSAKRKARFGQLSGGQKQRLSVALALVGRPEVAVLDELTTGLDPQTRRETWALVEQIRDRGVTVVLVTHFMAEAERLCDRLAVIDRGRVAALDTPDGLVRRLEVSQQIRFRPSAPLADDLLAGLPGVTRVERHGPLVQVEGSDEAVNSVTSVLARHQILALDLRIEQASLDDAFVRLVGQSPGTEN